MEIKTGDVVSIQGSKDTYTVVDAEGGGHNLIDQRGHSAWVPNAKIVSPKLPTPAAVRKAKKTATVAPLIYKDDADYDALLSYLLATGYTLRAQGRPEGIDIIREEYRQWTGGEELDAMHVREHAEQFSVHEWFIHFKYTPEMPCPFPLVQMGTGGGQGKPCGLVDGSRVTVCWAVIVEELVKLGLRARQDLAVSFGKAA